eukprot:12656314-Alexandrium_andersonii.AAC.1
MGAGGLTPQGSTRRAPVDDRPPGSVARRSPQTVRPTTKGIGAQVGTRRRALPPFLLQSPLRAGRVRGSALARTHAQTHA